MSFLAAELEEPKIGISGKRLNFHSLRDTPTGVKTQRRSCLHFAKEKKEQLSPEQKLTRCHLSSYSTTVLGA